MSTIKNTRAFTFQMTTRCPLSANGEFCLLRAGRESAGRRKGAQYSGLASLRHHYIARGDNNLTVGVLLSGKGIPPRHQLLEVFVGLKRETADDDCEASVYEMMLTSLHDDGPPDPEKMPDWFRGVVQGGAGS